LQVRVPVSPGSHRPLAFSRQALQLRAVVHGRPPTATVQARLSVRVTPGPQVPLAHAELVHVRDSVPAGSQLDIVVCTQTPYAPQISPPPQGIPSVSRAQAIVSTEVWTPHAPAEQVGLLTDRLRVPLRSHASAKPPHGLHAPRVGAPHAAPSVSRGQPPVSVSTRSVGTHSPAAPQENVVTVRERSPVVAHTDANVHAP
jgi:hypothetical protein